MVRLEGMCTDDFVNTRRPFVADDRPPSFRVRSNAKRACDSIQGETSLAREVVRDPIPAGTVTSASYSDGRIGADG